MFHKILFRITFGSFPGSAKSDKIAEIQNQLLKTKNHYLSCVVDQNSAETVAKAKGEPFHIIDSYKRYYNEYSNKLSRANELAKKFGFPEVY